MAEPITEDKGGGSEVKEEAEETELELQVPSRPDSVEVTPERNLPTSPASGSVASDLHSIKSPDFDERELEDIQLNDRSEDQEENERYSPLPKFNLNAGEDESAKDQEENYESLPTPTTETSEKEGSNDDKVELEQKQPEQVNINIWKLVNKLTESTSASHLLTPASLSASVSSPLPSSSSFNLLFLPESNY